MKAVEWINLELPAKIPKMVHISFLYCNYSVGNRPKGNYNRIHYFKTIHVIRECLWNTRIKYSQSFDGLDTTQKEELRKAVVDIEKTIKSARETYQDMRWVLLLNMAAESGNQTLNRRYNSIAIKTSKSLCIINHYLTTLVVESQ